MEFASNQTLAHSVKTWNLSAPGDVEVLFSRKIKQDEIAVLKYKW